MKGEEVKIIKGIKEKLKKRFPKLLEIAEAEFLGFSEKEVIESPHSGQFFYGWFFGSFCLYDGKTIPCLCGESLDLNEKEKRLLENIQNAISGFFEIIEIKDKEYFLKDLLTKKEYVVKTIDMDYKVEAGEILEANLVKNMNEDYFFFGGFIIRDEKERILMNLEEYKRDLNIDELVKREFKVIQKLMKYESLQPLESYLVEILGLSDKEIEEFIDSSEDRQKEILKKVLIDIEMMDYSDVEVDDFGDTYWEGETYY